MEKIIYLILGALLAIGGSFLAQRNQLILNSIEKERTLLFRASSLLLEYNLNREEFALSPKESATLDSKIKLIELDLRRGKILEEISGLTVQICSKKHRTICVQLAKFSLHDSFRSEENLCELTRCIHLLINKDMIVQYEKEIEESPLEMKKII